MVKRPKSPETNEEERYFIVYQPYPLNANWEVPADYIQFIRWIAACIGTDPVHALHYKPSARSMVIVEIDKKYSEHHRLLGEHRWKDFLKQPTKHEAESVSQIFYCLYNTGREAQKDGWKRIHVETPWFRDWDPTTVFKDPYPSTHWCPTPPEDKTNKSLCRPLPVKDLPPPPKPIPLVVGSENWASAKTGSSSSKFQQPKKQGKQNGKAKQPTVDTSNAGAANAPSPSSASPHWNKPILQSTASPAQPKPSPPASPATPVSLPPNAWAKRPTPKAPEPPVLPPGLSIQRTPGQNLIIPPPGLTKPSISNGSSTTSGPGGSASASSWDGRGNDAVTSTIVRPPDLDGDESGDEEDVMNPWEGGGDALSPPPPSDAVDPSVPTAASESADAPVDLWGDETGLTQKREVAKCPYHGQLCKKGVCGWRAKQVKEEERLEKLGKAIDEGSRGRGGGARGRGWRRQSHGAADTDSAAGDDGYSTVSSRSRGRGRRW